MADKIKKVHATLPYFDKDNNYIRILQIKKSMTLHQQKIFDAVLSTVQDMHKKGLIDRVIEEGDLELDFDIFYGYLMKGSRIKKINRNELRQAMNDLTQISFSWDINDGENDEVGSFVIFQKGVIDFKNNRVRITFGKDFRTDGLISPAAYTKLAYKYLNKFKSQYTRVLYQYFKMLIGSKDRPFRRDITLSVEYLFNLLGINEETNKEYVIRRASFVKRCVEPAMKEMNEYSDINIRYKTVRGRSNKILEIYFEFDRKEGIDEAKHKNIIHAENVLTESDEKKGPLFFDDKVTDFITFKNKVIENYRGKNICVGPAGFLEDVIIKISENGYLENTYSNQHLNPDDAKKVWEWLFSNQSKLGNIQIQKKEDNLNLYNKKVFYVDDIKENVTIVAVIKESETYRVSVVSDTGNSGAITVDNLEMLDKLIKEGKK